MAARYGEDRRRHARRSPMARRSRSARSRSAWSRPATCWAAPRSVLEHGGQRIVVSGDYKRRPRPDLPAASSPCPATSSSPRRPSACRCSAIRPTTGRDRQGCCTRCALFPERAIWSAPMRSARPARDRAAARGRLRPADLSPRRAERAAARSTRRSASTLGDRCAPVTDAARPRRWPARSCSPAVGDRRPLVAPLPRSGAGLRLGLDARARARPPAAASSCRW